ncbi:MAG TPA: hypothetical protein PLO89_11295, partial [Spirochaetota bacterium]|nr:hypothetical protein [Spirochaetota bacterium]
KLANDSLSDFEAQNGAKWIVNGDELAKGEYNVYLLADAATANPMTTAIWGTKMVKMTKNSSTGLYEVTLEKSKTTYAEWGTPEEFLNTKVAVVKSTDVAQFENDPSAVPFYTFPKIMGTLAVDYAKLEKDKETNFKTYENALTDTEYTVLKITFK